MASTANVSIPFAHVVMAHAKANSSNVNFFIFDFVFRFTMNGREFDGMLDGRLGDERIYRARKVKIESGRTQTPKWIFVRKVWTTSLCPSGAKLRIISVSPLVFAKFYDAEGEKYVCRVG